MWSLDSGPASHIREGQALGWFGSAVVEEEIVAHQTRDVQVDLPIVVKVPPSRALDKAFDGQTE